MPSTRPLRPSPKLELLLSAPQVRLSESSDRMFTQLLWPMTARQFLTPSPTGTRTIEATRKHCVAQYLREAKLKFLGPISILADQGPLAASTTETRNRGRSISAMSFVLTARPPEAPISFGSKLIEHLLALFLNRQAFARFCKTGSMQGKPAVSDSIGVIRCIFFVLAGLLAFAKAFAVSWSFNQLGQDSVRITE